MQKNSRVSGGAVGLIAIVVLFFGFVIVQPTLAQATTTDPASEAAATPTVAGASTSAVTADPPPPPPPPPPLQTTSTDGLAEVQLLCSQSYTGILYNTPSGHLEAGYFLGSESASTTGMTVAHEIGQQAWTVCHDARGHVHEFMLTAAEYEALKIRGTPHKSVMEPVDEAALDTFPPEPETDTSETSTSTI